MVTARVNRVAIHVIPFPAKHSSDNGPQATLPLAPWGRLWRGARRRTGCIAEGREIGPSLHFVGVLKTQARGRSGRRFRARSRQIGLALERRRARRSISVGWQQRLVWLGRWRLLVGGWRSVVYRSVVAFPSAGRFVLVYRNGTADFEVAATNGLNPPTRALAFASTHGRT